MFLAEMIKLLGTTCSPQAALSAKSLKTDFRCLVSTAPICSSDNKESFVVGDFAGVLAGAVLFFSSPDV